MPRIGKSLSRVVAAGGALSRRLAEHAVRSGRVTVGGAVCLKPASRVEEGDMDSVKLDGIAIDPPAADAIPELWRYYKPRGLLTTHNDPEGRCTVCK